MGLQPSLSPTLLPLSEPQFPTCPLGSLDWLPPEATLSRPWVSDALGPAEVALPVLPPEEGQGGVISSDRLRNRGCPSQPAVQEAAGRNNSLGGLSRRIASDGNGALPGFWAVSGVGSFLHLPLD